MADATRQTLFLACMAALGLFTLAAGVWLFWLSGAVQLLLTGSVMLLVAVATAYWKMRAAPPAATGPEAPGSADRQ